MREKDSDVLPYYDLMRSVVSPGFCTGCGTCAGMCPEGSIRMQSTRYGGHVPVFFSATCCHCGLCVDSCPIYSGDYAVLNKALFGKIPENRLLGNYIQCYTGYAKDPDIRWRGSSGGVVTALLLFLLRERLIDGALVTRMVKGDPLRGEPFLARSENDILSSIGSKYIPIPVNQLLSEIRCQSGRFAVVGLPCHIQGIRMAELKHGWLRGKIAYRLGLICSHTFSSYGVEFILRKMKIPCEDLAELSFRGGGWPGGLKATLKDGTIRHVPTLDSWWSEMFGGYFFCYKHCTFCPDLLAEFADLTFGDAWIPQVLKRDNLGTSLVLARTAIGKQLLSEAAAKQVIEVSPLDADDAARSQLFMTQFKKRNILARMALFRLLRRRISPSLNTWVSAFSKPDRADYIAASLPYLNIWMSRFVLSRRLLEHVPLKTIRRYRAKFKRLVMHS